jgi:hypothetical protein
MQQHDLSVRDELAADGSLFDGYHPRMEAVHRANAAMLRQVIAEHGWPNEELVGPDGAEAAWLVAQHSIGEPEFMRACRTLLAAEAEAGTVPRWQHAYLHDRVQVSEGKPQRYGTQFEITPDGPVVCEVDDPGRLDEIRKAVGLGPLQEHLKTLASQPLPSPEEYRARKAAELAWRTKIGW